MKKLNFLVFLIIGFTGCAFTQSVTPLNYQYSGSVTVKFNRQIGLNVEQFKDSRDVANANVIFHKSNEYGKTSGTYQAERPLAEIVRDGIIAGLKQSGVVEGMAESQFRLEGELLENDYEIKMGFWTGSVTNNLTVKMRLFEIHSGEMVWQDTFIGKATDKTAWGTTNFLLDLAKSSIDNLVEKVLEDEYFRKTLEK